jgi:predicted nuclease of predicted toxin-antitoxin system
LAYSAYLDHQVHGYVGPALRQLGIDCLTAEEDGRADQADEVLLARASTLGRVLISYDKDFYALHAAWLSDGRRHGGIIRVRKGDYSPARLLGELALILLASHSGELESTLTHVPL